MAHAAPRPGTAIRAQDRAGFFIGNDRSGRAPGASACSTREANRLYPPITAISRAAKGPDVLAGERIRRGTTVVIAPYVLHRHRALWQRPDSFDPTRFLGESRNAIDRFAYLPFGVGPRICIGATFAIQEASIMVAMIVRNFTLEMTPGHSPWPVQKITLRPDGGLPMIFHRRRC